MSVNLKNGRRLVWTWDIVGYFDHTPRVIDVASGATLFALEGHSAMVRGGLELEDGRIVTWANDATLRIWRPTDGHCELVFDKHATWASNVIEWTPGSIVSLDDSGVLLWWDARSGEALWHWSPADDDKGDIRLRLVSQANGLVLQVGNREICLVLIDVANRTERWRISLGSGYWTTEVALIDAGYIAAVGSDEVVHIYRISDGTWVRCLPVGRGSVGLLGLEDGRLLTQCWDRSLKRHLIQGWEVETGRFIDQEHIAGEEALLFTRTERGQVLLSLADYQRFEIFQERSIYAQSVPLLPTSTSPCPSFDPEVTGEVWSSPSAGTPELSVRRFHSWHWNTHRLPVDQNLCGVRTDDGQIVVCRDDDFGLLDFPRSAASPQWLSKEEFVSQHRDAYARWLDRLCVDTRDRNERLAARLAWHSNLPVVRIDEALNEALAAYPSDAPAWLAPAAAGEILIWGRDRLPCLLTADESRASVDLVRLEAPDGGDWQANRPAMLIDPAGVLHAFDGARILELRDPRTGSPVAMPLAERDSNRYGLRWCAGDRIAFFSNGGLAVLDGTMQQIAFLQNANGINLTGFIELTDGTLVTQDRSTLRSWSPDTLEPLVELRDPSEWGPGYGALIAMRDVPAMAFYSGKYSHRSHLTIWDGCYKMQVFGAASEEIVKFVDLGGGTCAICTEEDGIDHSLHWLLWH